MRRTARGSGSRPRLAEVGRSAFSAHRRRILPVEAAEELMVQEVQERQQTRTVEARNEPLEDGADNRLNLNSTRKISGASCRHSAENFGRCLLNTAAGRLGGCSRTSLFPKRTRARCTRSRGVSAPGTPRFYQLLFHRRRLATSTRSRETTSILARGDLLPQRPSRRVKGFLCLAPERLEWDLPRPAERMRRQCLQVPKAAPKGDAAIGLAQLAESRGIPVQFAVSTLAARGGSDLPDSKWWTPQQKSRRAACPRAKSAVPFRQRIHSGAT